MEIIASLMLLALVLGAWIRGSWIGRGVILLAGVGLTLLSSGHNPEYLLIGAPLSWVVASAPTWIRRKSSLAS